jgi:hypothetical protein
MPDVPEGHESAVHVARQPTWQEVTPAAAGGRMTMRPSEEPGEAVAPVRERPTPWVSDVLQAELDAAVRLVRWHRPASLLLRLSCDRTGIVRVKLEGSEGLRLDALAGAEPSREG